MEASDSENLMLVDLISHTDRMSETSGGGFVGASRKKGGGNAFACAALLAVCCW